MPKPSIPAIPHRRRLAPLLRRTWHSLNQTFRRRIAHSGLTPDQFTVVRWLTELGDEGATANQLCALMTCDPNTMAVLLRRMQEAGLITRKHHETDGRSWRIEITALGSEKYNIVYQIAINLQQEALSAIPKENRNEFLDQLELLANKCYSLLE